MPHSNPFPTVLRRPFQLTLQISSTEIDRVDKCQIPGLRKMPHCVQYTVARFLSVMRLTDGDVTTLLVKLVLPITPEE